MSPGESGDVMRASRIQMSLARNDNEILILSHNIQCLLAHLEELIIHLNLHRPYVVLLQETWLDESVSHVTLPGYQLVSRRDRSPIANQAA